jgi:predicted nucleic acid-binding protein
VEIYYFDTSALIKHYLNEIGSSVVNQLIADDSNDLVIVSITMVEAFAGITRRIRRGDLIYGDLDAVLSVAQHEFNEKFIVLGTTIMIIQRAMNLARRRALRGYDAIQLAAALEFQSNLGQEAIAFVCADDELNRAAADEGLAILNPNEPMSNSNAG